MADVSRHRLRAATVVVALIAAVTVAAPGASAAPTPSATPADGIGCFYRLISWPGGFMADLYMTNNTATPINGWKAQFSFTTPTTLGSVWMAAMTQDASTFTAVNTTFNGVISPGQTTAFGWTASAATTEIPTDITVNGARC